MFGFQNKDQPLENVSNKQMLGQKNILKVENKEFTVGIFLYDEREKKILIVHPTNGSQKYWSIPKGLKDGKEDSFTAGIRELKEETNKAIGEIESQVT